MKLRVDGRTYRGRALDVHGVDPGAVAAAVRGEPSPVAVTAPEPDRLFDRVGAVTGEATVSVRATLAAAARTLGWETPHDDELTEVQGELATEDPPETDPSAARKRAAEARERVAEARERESRLHERVAQLRGRVRTLRERGEATEEAERRLRDAAAELTEVRTERLAAEEELDRAEDRLRTARDRRERRLSLADRRDNLRRAARRHLAERVWDRFRTAVRAVPGDVAVGEAPGTYRGDGTTAALAALRIGDPDPPAVLACGRFPDAPAAADCLGTAVVRVPPDGT